MKLLCKIFTFTYFFAILKCMQIRFDTTFPFIKNVGNKEIVPFYCSWSLALDFHLIGPLFMNILRLTWCENMTGRDLYICLCSQYEALSGAIWKCTHALDCVGLTAPDGGATYYLWCDSNIHRGPVYKTQAYGIVQHLQLPCFADIKVKEQSMENLMR